ncbi:MAG: FAD:protein FMN transferase [Planctomycetales bacterium]
MMVNRRTFMMVTGGAFLTSTLPSLAGSTQIIGGSAFGSWWRASLPPTSDTREVWAAITEVIETIEASMSPYKASSELSLLNRSLDGQWIPLSDSIGQVISESLRIARLTDGAFDPTVGPLVRRYGFGPISGAVAVDYRSMVLGEQGIRKSMSKATLDLCGIAKGYAIDRMALVLEALGIRSFLLEAGGEVLARGRHPDGRSWQVGIETPGLAVPALRCIVRLEGMVLATSGNAINGGTETNVAFSHIIDSRTARPVANNVASVSVIAETGLQADALATALVVMGAESGLELAEKLNLAVFFQLREGPRIFETMSEGFAQYMVA